jgi:hypothetical protein
LAAVTVLGKWSDTESVPVWKDSILPLVLMGSADDMVMYVGKVGEMERAAGKLDAVLQQRDGKWALVVEHRSDRGQSVISRKQQHNIILQLDFSPPTGDHSN